MAKSILSHTQEYVKDLAKLYFKYKDTNYAKWIVRIKMGQRADILSIFLLSKITKTHTFIHLGENRFWSALKEEPTEHSEFIQKTNLHLAYAGRNISVQLTNRATLLHYEIFGVNKPQESDTSEVKLVIVSMVTSEEDETLNTLLAEGLTRKQSNKAPSASAGSVQDPLRVEAEMQTHLSASTQLKKPKTEPVLILVKLMEEDIKAAKCKSKCHSRIEVPVKPK